MTKGTGLFDVLKNLGHKLADVWIERRASRTVRPHHVAMAVKCLDTSEKLLVVSQRNQDLSVIAHCLLQHGQRSLRDLMLLQSPQLSLVEL